jgi:hypothetical protein
MLSTADKLSNIKCRVARASYTKMIESNYGIETCEDDYSELMLLDDLLTIDLISSGYTCGNNNINIIVTGLDLSGAKSNTTPQAPGGIRYSFLAPSSEWVINNLDSIGFTFNPNVTVLDLNNSVIEADISYPVYGKKIVISFNDPMTGYVDLT